MAGTVQAFSSLRVAAAVPLLLLLGCWVGGGAAAAQTLTVSTARLAGRSDKEADELLRRCEKNPKTGKTRGKCSPIEAYIAKCVKAHNWRCLRCTFNTGKGITAAKSRCTQVRSPGLFVLKGGEAVCRPGVEPLAGFTKQNVRKCRPGFAKRGNGNFKCILCFGRGWTPRIGATSCRICPAGYTINKARTTCTAPAKKPTPGKLAPKKPPPLKRPPPRRPPPSPIPSPPPGPNPPPPPPPCVGLQQDIFRLNAGVDLQSFTYNVLLSNTPLPIGRPCPGGCTYPYDPSTPNITRTVDQPTNGYCDFTGTAPCGQVGPSAVPYYQSTDRTCPVSYSSFSAGGEVPPPNGGNDFFVPGLGLHYLVRWTGSITIPETTAYTFAAGADDGVRLVIDGDVVLEKQGFSGVSYEFCTITLTAGVHAIDVQFYEWGGGSALVLLWNWNGTHTVNQLDTCDRRRRLTGFPSPIGGSSYFAVPKSAFCAPAPV